MAGQYRMILDMLTEEYTQLSSWAFGKSNNEGFDEYVIDNDEYLASVRVLLVSWATRFTSTLSHFAATTNASDREITG